MRYKIRGRNGRAKKSDTRATFHVEPRVFLKLGVANSPQIIRCTKPEFPEFALRVPRSRSEQTRRFSPSRQPGSRNFSRRGRRRLHLEATDYAAFLILPHITVYIFVYTN